MRRGKPWTRFLAVLLAAAMLMTSQSIVSAADTVQDMIQSGKTAEDVSSQEEKEEPIATESNGTKEETGSEVKEETDKKNEDTKDEDKNTTSQKKETSDKKTDTDQKKTDQKETEDSGKQKAPAKKNEEQSLADKKSGVKLIYSSSQLPEDVKLQVEEKKETDSDYPKQAKEDIAAKLEKEENLSLTDIAFYDINLGGGQPSGKIEVKLPVPKNWTGELDAWYINDQGTVTYMDREKEDTEGYYTFKTDHFSLYALSVSEPKEEEKADEKKDEEQTAEPAPQNAEPKDGDEDTNGQTFAEAAEAHYGKGGTTATASATITNQGSSEVKTGETVSFLIDYKLAAAATYNYGEHSQPLFDTYDDTKIILHLPEGLSVVEGAAGTLQNVTDVISPEEAGIETNDWVLVMNDSIAAASDSVGTFIVNLAIDGNGSTEVGHTLLWSSIFVTPVAKKYRFMQFELDRVFGSVK